MADLKFDIALFVYLFIHKISNISRFGGYGPSSVTWFEIHGTASILASIEKSQR